MISRIDTVNLTFVLLSIKINNLRTIFHCTDMFNPHYNLKLVTYVFVDFQVLNLKPKILEETISHARRCIINERMYSFIDFQEKEGVVFNIVGEVLGLILESHYLPMHQLSESDKA